jgi:CRP/FNR family cyclic AMP-dependent transcriptional regulator
MDADEFMPRLAAEDIADLWRRGRRRRWPRGGTLMAEGDRSDWVALLETGRVKVSYHTDHGDEILLAIRGPGALLGELGTLDHRPRAASVTALEPVEALAVPAPQFTEFLRTRPGAAFHLLQLLSHRLRDADTKRIEFSAYDTLGRVARRIIELADRFGTHSPAGVRITLPLSQQELAAWTGSSREATAKALRTLRDRGWIETRRREIVIIDPDALRRRTD